jgi:hypothetical protein
MKKAIINTNRGWKDLSCKATCTNEEREACPHNDCFRRNLRSEGGIETCPHLKNGIIEINVERPEYIEQSKTAKCHLCGAEHDIEEMFEHDIVGDDEWIERTELVCTKCFHKE